MSQEELPSIPGSGCLAESLKIAVVEQMYTQIDQSTLSHCDFISPEIRESNSP